MELKKGYVQTEVGVIPEDWELLKVDQLIDLLTDYDANGSFSSVAENVNVFDKQEFAWYVRSTDLENNTPISDVRYVDEGSYNFLKKTSLYGNELLFLKRGDIGNVYLFKNKTRFATLAPNLYLLKLNSKSNSTYLFNFFKSEIGQIQLKRKNAGSTLGALYKNDVKSILVPLPSIHEQQKIAEVLSDTDALIRSLEKKIAKKEAIKQGIMQEILRYRGDWQKTSLIELVENNRNLFNDGDWIEAEHIRESGIRLIQTGNIGIGEYTEKGNQKFIDYNSFTSLRCKELEEGDMLICRLAEPAGRACIFEKDKSLKTITSVDVTIFRPSPDKVNRYFLTQYFSTNEWFSKVNEHVGGTTHKRISRGALGLIEFLIPSIAQQNKFAKILLEINRELNLLRFKKKKLTSLKHSLMQQLLTGKIRIV